MQNITKFLILSLGLGLIFIQTLLPFILGLGLSNSSFYYFLGYNHYAQPDFIIACLIGCIIVYRFSLVQRYEFNFGFILILFSIFAYHILLNFKANIYLYFVNHKDQIPFEYYSKFRFLSDSLVYISLYIGFLIIFSSNLPQRLEDKALEQEF